MSCQKFSLLLLQLIFLLFFLPFPYPSAVEKCHMWSAKSAAVSSGQCSLVNMVENLNLHFIYLLDHCPLSSICFWEKRLFYFFAPIFTSPLVSYCVKGDEMHPDYLCLFNIFSQRSQLAREIPGSSHLSSGTTTALCFRLCGEAHVAALGAKVHYCSFIIHNPKILRYLYYSSQILKDLPSITLNPHFYGLKGVLTGWKRATNLIRI